MLRDLPDATLEVHVNGAILTFTRPVAACVGLAPTVGRHRFVEYVFRELPHGLDQEQLVVSVRIRPDGAQ